MALLQAAGAPDVAMHLRGIADGVVFVVQSALALGATLATVLAVAPGSVRNAVIGTLLFALAAVGAGWLPLLVPASALAPGVLLLLGAVIASGLRLRGVAGWIALVIGGVAAGVAGGLQTATWEEAVGSLAVLAAFALTGLVIGARLVPPQRVQRGAALARRMAGAWIAAVGVLLVALWLRRGG